MSISHLKADVMKTQSKSCVYFTLSTQCLTMAFLASQPMWLWMLLWATSASEWNLYSYMQDKIDTNSKPKMKITQASTVQGRDAKTLNLYHNNVHKCWDETYVTSLWVPVEADPRVGTDQGMRSKRCYNKVKHADYLSGKHLVPCIGAALLCQWAYVLARTTGTVIFL